MIIIDATSLVAGRIATFAAKKALLGERVVIVNADKAVITGRKEFLKEFFNERKDRGHVYDGPFYPKMADRILRRIIRGMLPYKQERGKNAYKKIMCYIGVPKEFQGKKFETIANADAAKLKTSNFLELAQVSKIIGK